MDVSACTIVTSLTRSCFLSSASSISAGNGLPHSLSSTTTFAPTRSAMSSIRCPKKPHTHMITVSPGSSRLLIPTSMPADPVPETDKVRPSSVSKTRLSSSETSSIIFTKSGSRYPIIGVIMACRTRGCAVLGPGPSSMRGGTIGTSDRGSSLAVMRPPDSGFRAWPSYRTKAPSSWAGPHWKSIIGLAP